MFSYRIDGTKMDSQQMRLMLGGTVSLTKAASVTLKAAPQFGAHTHAYGVSGGVKWEW